jgi:histidyl-tRNA synthetase
VGIEAIGLSDPLLDVEVIAVADRAFRQLGLKNYRLEITSLGDALTRANYLTELRAYIATLDLDEETKARAEINPLRLFDDKRPEIRSALAGAPILMEYLTPESAADFEVVKTSLAALNINYVVNNRMVRGLDYYTGTAFEFVHEGLGAQSGIGGGGRYDGLMAQLGGASLSGIGFGLGVDRILLACEAEGLSMPKGSELDLFIVPLGTAPAALVIAEELRERGLRVGISYGDRALKGGMKAADKSGARYSIVLGADELASGEVALKAMKSGESQSVTLSLLANHLIELTVDFGDHS